MIIYTRFMQHAQHGCQTGLEDVPQEVLRQILALIRDAPVVAHELLQGHLLLHARVVPPKSVPKAKNRRRRSVFSMIIEKAKMKIVSDFASA